MPLCTVFQDISSMANICLINIVTDTQSIVIRSPLAQLSDSIHIVLNIHPSTAVNLWFLHMQESFMNFQTMALGLSLPFLQVPMSLHFFSDLNYDLSQIECEVFSILVIVIIKVFLLLNMSLVLDKNTQKIF